jgi:hypothetical protein
MDAQPKPGSKEPHMTDAKRSRWQWSACDMAEAIAARRVTTVDAVGSVVARARSTAEHRLH